MATEDKDLDRPSLLLNAARKGDVEDVKELLSDGLYPDSPLTQSGRTLLHVTAHHGHLDVLLLVAGRYKMDPNVVNKVRLVLVARIGRQFSLLSFKILSWRGLRGCTVRMLCARIPAVMSYLTTRCGGFVIDYV